MIDRKSLENYRHMEGPFGNRLHNSIDWKESSFRQYEGRCAFLNEDNLCDIYDVRPKACAAFPHTDRKKIYQINHLTIKNTLFCPAAYLFVEKLKDRI